MIIILPCLHAQFPSREEDGRPSDETGENKQQGEDDQRTFEAVG